MKKTWNRGEFGMIWCATLVALMVGFAILEVIIYGNWDMALILGMFGLGFIGFFFFFRSCARYIVEHGENKSQDTPKS